MDAPKPAASAPANLAGRNNTAWSVTAEPAATNQLPLEPQVSYLAVSSSSTFYSSVIGSAGLIWAPAIAPAAANASLIVPGADPAQWVTQNTHTNANLSYAIRQTQSEPLRLIPSPSLVPATAGPQDFIAAHPADHQSLTSCTSHWQLTHTHSPTVVNMAPAGLQPSPSAHGVHSAEQLVSYPGSNQQLAMPAPSGFLYAAVTRGAAGLAAAPTQLQGSAVLSAVEIALRVLFHHDDGLYSSAYPAAGAAELATDVPIATQDNMQQAGFEEASVQPNLQELTAVAGAPGAAQTGIRLNKRKPRRKPNPKRKPKTAIAGGSKGGVKKRIRCGEAGKASKGQQSMRQAVRSLKGLLGRRATYLYTQLRRQYPAYADEAGNLKQAGSHAFLHVVLGGDRELWPRKEELREDGVTIWMARVLSWAADGTIEPAEVNVCFKNGGKNSYETNDEWLKDKGLFAWNWTFPLTQSGISSTAAEPTRQSVQLSEEETQIIQHAMEAAAMLYPPTMP